jgi:HAD domain in Swiss Army Knife RNA repair proteins
VIVMEVNNRPIIALDVDGVLSPDVNAKQRKHLWYHEKWRRKAVRWGLGVSQLIVNPEAAVWLQKLAFDANAELVWATHWNHHANDHVAPLITLPQLPVIHTPAYPKLKAPALIEWSAGRPLVWFEDEPREVETARCFRASRGKFLGVLTDSKVGLTIDHIAQARKWLTALP